MQKKDQYLRHAGTALLCLAALVVSGGATSLIMGGELRTAEDAPEAQAVISLAGDAELDAPINWVEFDVPLEVLEQALQYDVNSYGQAVELDWLSLLAYAAAQNGGNFRGGRQSAEIDALAERLQAGESLSELTDGMRYYAYYREAYGAVLGGFVGEVIPEGGGEPEYGLQVYSPIARDFGFGHYDDFGNPRSYGYKRLHLGNDLMGAIGTPIIAVEGGVITALGWNEYGGWRVGIKSHDGLRYYYYAHMRKDTPYAKSIYEGGTVEAGDVIGYMGMTGYSKEENVNNINVPHLHFGMQLLLNGEQADEGDEIWVDVYQIVRLLERRRMPVVKGEGPGEYVRADEEAAQ